MSSGRSPIREDTAAILVSTDGRLLFKLRDNLPGVSDPGKIGLFGGRREGDESFLDCVVREVHEEISRYLAPEQFEFIGRYFGPDHVTPGGTRHCEVFVARDVPVDELTITEGRLIVASFDELEQIRDQLAPSSRYLLEMLEHAKRLGHVKK